MEFIIETFTSVFNLYLAIVTFLPLGSNIPTRPSYLPPPDTDPTDEGSVDLEEEAAGGGLSLPVIETTMNNNNNIQWNPSIKDIIGTSSF